MVSHDDDPPTTASGWKRLNGFYKRKHDDTCAMEERGLEDGEVLSANHKRQKVE